MRFIVCLLAGAAMLGAAASATAAPLLASVFTDHAVLQRGRPIRVWGIAEPGGAVAIDLSGQAAQARADAQGRWSAELPARPADGIPLALTVRSGGAVQTVSDLLMGDVWLCSGQSNMEYPLRRALNGEAEAAGAADPHIRLLQTGRASFPDPVAALPAAAVWKVSSQASAGDFSAACYFMGREIRKAARAPIGLIDATWGGSIIQDWISKDGLRALGGYEEGLAILADYARSPAQGQARWTAMLNAWAARAEPHAADWAKPGFDDRAWASLPSGGFWETQPGLETFDGVIWLRAEIMLTKAQAAQAATLALGPVDDIDTTFVNGRVVGSQEGWNTPRAYALPAGVLKAGRNLVAVRVIDSGGGGGAWGEAADKGLKLADGSFAPLGASWRYKISGTMAELGAPPHVPWMGASGLSTLHNGMIAPLAPYGVKGFAWYQGESNVNEAKEYARLAPALIADWRRIFAVPDAPFLIVQLAAYGPPATAPGVSAWAALRDVQRRVAAADPNAGLASAVDLGSPYDIHPADKLQVGLRLAGLARLLAYDETSNAAGPVPLSATRDGQTVVVRLDQPAVVYGSGRPAGFELCDADEACRFVDATLEGDEILLAVPPGYGALKVRYAWSDSPIVNLYGLNRLPASPFEFLVQ